MNRLDYLQELEAFIKQSKFQLTEILSELNWSEEGLLSVAQANEDEKDNANISSSSTTNKLEMEEGSSKDSEQVYQEIMSSLPQPSKIEREKTALELLAEERNAKRRRISYKNKVHTKHKSQNEILREVISQQMEALEGWLTGPTENETENVPRESESEVPDDRMIEITSVLGTNPHKAWQKVAKMIEREAKLKEDREKARLDRRDCRNKEKDHRDKRKEDKNRFSGTDESIGEFDKNAKKSYEYSERERPSKCSKTSEKNIYKHREKYGNKGYRDSYYHKQDEYLVKSEPDHKRKKHKHSSKTHSKKKHKKNKSKHKLKRKRHSSSSDSSTTSSDAN